MNENVGTATLTVSLSNPVDIATTVDVKYADVTATGGGLDYDSTTDTVVFAAGKVAPQTVTVSIVDDSLTETLEVFQRCYRARRRWVTERSASPTER